MAEVTTLGLVFRLVVAGICILGPTVLYFGLWRFLVWLRDDELVERLAERGGPRGSTTGRGRRARDGHRRGRRRALSELRDDERPGGPPLSQLSPRPRVKPIALH
jgi:hypothetical protein